MSAPAGTPAPIVAKRNHEKGENKELVMGSAVCERLGREGEPAVRPAAK